VTLVVARIVERHVAIVSDLRVTDPDEIRRGYPYGVLKAIVLAPDLCVAFAGSVDEALDAVTSLPIPASSEAFPEIAEALAARTRRGRRSAEYLVASSNPPRLARIRDGIVEQSRSTWIGDLAAFNEYQRIFLDPARPRPTLPAGQLQPPELAVVGSMSMAMGELVRSEAVPSVGESAILLRTTEASVFQYQTLAMVQASPQSIPSGVRTTMRFGSAAEGGFAFSMLTPTEPGAAVIGIYFAQGRVGLLYQPLASRYPVSYAPVSHDEFRTIVRENHGVDIQGVEIT
jgi:hypothetical protein